MEFQSVPHYGLGKRKHNSQSRSFIIYQWIPIDIPHLLDPGYQRIHKSTLFIKIKKTKATYELENVTIDYCDDKTKKVANFF